MLEEIPESISQLYEQKRPAPRFTLAGYSGWAYCSSVYDGDTCHLSLVPPEMHNAYLWTCRLARIQAPEIGCHAHSDHERDLGVRAREALAQCILNKVVYVEVIGEGKFGRPLVELYVHRPFGTSVNVNQQMIDDGFAVLYEQPLPWRSAK